MYFETDCDNGSSGLQGRPRSLILAPIESEFLLVINNNLGPVLPRFRDIAGFLL